MGRVEQALVTRVSVNSRHEATLNAERVVQSLRHGGEAVRGAGRVGDDVVGLRVVVALVHTHHDGGVNVLAWRGDQDLLHTVLQVSPRGLSVSEQPGRLNHDVNAEVAPWDGGRVTLSEHLDFVSVNGDGILPVGDFTVEAAQHGVVLQHVGERAWVSEVVLCYDLNVCTLVFDGAVVVPADPSETINSYADGHYVLLMCP